jgi:hypothetical protein
MYGGKVSRVRKIKEEGRKNYLKRKINCFTGRILIDQKWDRAQELAMDLNTISKDALLSKLRNLGIEATDRVGCPKFGRS